MGDELDRPAARGRSALRVVHQRDSLLPLPPRGEAGNLGLGAGQPGPCGPGRRSPSQAAVRLLLHQIFFAVARPPDPVSHDQDDADRVGRALIGAVSRIVRNTGSTPSATTAIIAPGAMVQPVRSISHWASSGVRPPKTAVAMVAPSARPVTRPSPGNCSAVATAPTALNAPATAASASAPRRARMGAPLAISENIEIGSAALSSDSRIRMRRRPTRSDQAPVKGVTRITTTAARVDSHRESRSLKRPAEDRKAGT